VGINPLAFRQDTGDDPGDNRIGMILIPPAISATLSALGIFPTHVDGA
jgi:hypothetical protein